MAIWMDLTNSLMVWQGGVVGIVRAELEIAKNLHAIDPSVRFSVCTEKGFEEIASSELQWLWDSASVGDAYMKKMARGKYDPKAEEKKNEPNRHQQIENAIAFSESRLMRVKEAARLTISTLPTPLKQMTYYPAKLAYKPLKKASFCRANYLKRKKIQTVDTQVLNFDELSYPYKDGDTVFSCGWFTSEKEKMFSAVKSNLKDFRLVYVIYDIIILKKEFAHYYSVLHQRFSDYIEWISSNCDYILYGGQTAQKDTEAYFAEKELRIPPSGWIKFGNSVYKKETGEDDTELLKKMGVEEPYILSVGTIEPRKNYKTLYQAYAIMSEKYAVADIPDLVIVGQEAGDKDLYETILSHPFTREKIKILQPTDQELNALYENCEFTLLPSLYEGWSLTLPESLNYGKVCVCSDVMPLREIAGEITEFVEPLNPWAWAEKIMELHSDQAKIEVWEKAIEQNWKPITWNDCANLIYKELKTFIPEKRNNRSNIYYDMTLLWHSAFANSSVSGILRTQLLLARYFSRIYPNLKFCAITDQYYEFTRADLAHILGTGAIDVSFSLDRGNIMKSVFKQQKKIANIGKKAAGNENLKRAFWLLCSVMPDAYQQKVIGYAKRKVEGPAGNDSMTQKNVFRLPFKKGDILFNAGVGYPDLASYENLIKAHRKIGFYFVQLIYDYTPILVPQTHRKETIESYIPFLENSNKLADVIFYGGKTAMRDGIAYQKKNKQAVRPAHAVKFGSNIIGKKTLPGRVEQVLKHYQIEDDFILTVGSIEARKNHETLYKAYLKMLETDVDGVLPQLIICGYPGWKTFDFIHRLEHDERVKGKIICRSFSDEELDILYRNCRFTVLPSLYEGWSLTLPESLNYGKFSIASAVDPLMETGQDFIDYVHPYDSDGWAKKILYYANNPEALAEKERKIKEEWHTITWKECADETAKALDQLMEKGPESFRKNIEEFL